MSSFGIRLSEFGTSFHGPFPCERYAALLAARAVLLFLPHTAIRADRARYPTMRRNRRSATTKPEPTQRSR